MHALGLLLYVLLTDRPPCRLPLPAAGDTSGRDGALGIGELSAPSAVAPERRRVLRGDLDSIVRRATCADAQKRYGAVAELAQDVANHLARRPVMARPATLGYRAGALARRKGPLLAGAALAVVGLGGAAALGMWAAGRSVQPPAAAVSPAGPSEAAQSAEQLRVLVQRVGALATQGDREAQMALPLLHFARGHLLRIAGDAVEAQLSFRRGALARQAGPWAPPQGPLLATPDRPPEPQPPATRDANPQPARPLTKP